jgi:peptidoglycan/LPS O-acetylase OafA/YrhL
VAATTIVPGPSRTAFRADIEGLRAVAVVLVLLFHFDVPGFAGGYVGVDVFFVVSGYLITRLLLRERIDKGTIAFGDFYARRLRRLLPASTLVIVATVLASRWLMSPLLFESTAWDGVWAAGWLANMRFITVGMDYLAAEGVESPLLHFWSLAVEEQFYLLWPALILLVAWGRRGDVSRRVGIALAVVVGASLAASIVLTRTHPVIAYYSLPTRAWELAIGGLLAVAAVRGVRFPRRTSTIAGWLGVVAVVASGMLYTLQTPFPGWLAAVPVLGTAAIIVAGDADSRVGPVWFLRWRPLQFLGKLSYSLYLWHWPVLILGEHAVGRALTATERVGAMGLSILLAWVTYLVVEDPLRRARGLARPIRGFAFGGALVVGTLAVVAVSAVTLPAVVGTGEVDGPTIAAPTDVEEFRAILQSSVDAELLPASLQPPLREAGSTLPRIYDDGCFAGWEDEHSRAHCVYGDPQGERTVVLFGDSHAAHWFPPFESLAERHGWRLLVLTKPSCPTIDVEATRRGAPYPSCEPWRQHGIERIAREGADLVVLSNTRTYRPEGASAATPTDELVGYVIEGYRGMIGRLQEGAPGTRIAVLGHTPRPGYDVPVCLSQHLDDIGSCAADPNEALDPPLWAAEREAIPRTGATLVQPATWMCTSEACPAVVGDLLVYWDKHHLTVPFTSWLEPLLEDALLPLVEDPPRG